MFGLRPTDTHDDVDVEALAADLHGGAAAAWASGPRPSRRCGCRCRGRLNDFSMTLVTSLSSPGRILGSASRIVTFVPRSASIEANSHPITPPPMMAARFGSSAIDRNSSEVITIVPSTSKPGSVRGTEPGASTTASPVSSTSPDAPPDTVTRLPAWSRPCPSRTVTLRLFSSEPRPGHEAVDDRVLAGQRRAPVDRRLAGVDAEVRRLVDVQVGGGRLEQLLGRDAPDVQAGAAELALLDHGDVEPRRRAVERRGVAAGTAADDDDVVVLGRGDHLRGEGPCAGVRTLPAVRAAAYCEPPGGAARRAPDRRAEPPGGSSAAAAAGPGAAGRRGRGGGSRRWRRCSGRPPPA